MKQNGVSRFARTLVLRSVLAAALTVTVSPVARAQADCDRISTLVSFCPDLVGWWRNGDGPSGPGLASYIHDEADLLAKVDGAGSLRGVTHSLLKQFARDQLIKAHGTTPDNVTVKAEHNWQVGGQEASTVIYTVKLDNGSTLDSYNSFWIAENELLRVKSTRLETQPVDAFEKAYRSGLELFEIAE